MEGPQRPFFVVAEKGGEEFRSSTPSVAARSIHSIQVIVRWTQSSSMKHLGNAASFGFIKILIRDASVTSCVEPSGR
jgi:hypothetical protein